MVIYIFMGKKKEKEKEDNGGRARAKFLEASRKLLISFANGKKFGAEQKKDRKEQKRSVEQTEKRGQQRNQIKWKEKKLKDNPPIVVIDEDQSDKPSKNSLLLSLLDPKLHPPGPQKPKLPSLSLHTLLILFLSEITSPSPPTRVHQAISSEPSLQEQFDRLLALVLAEPQGGRNRFNQDWMIGQQGRMPAVVYARNIVTVCQHRALAMLLKKINIDKYSISTSQASPSRNTLTQQYYTNQYTLPIPQYYKSLLNLQLEHSRHLAYTPSTTSPVIGDDCTVYPPSNFIRRLLGRVFGERIKGEGEEREGILGLEERVGILGVAEMLLGRMRGDVKEGMQDGKGDRKEKEKEKVDVKNGQDMEIQHQPRTITKGHISQRQQQAITKTLQNFKKNRKPVPHPYCMFLEYRLRAQLQPKYSNPLNPSSDEDEEQSDDELYKVARERKKFRDLSVYRGYRGFKTVGRVREKRRIMRGIVRNGEEMANVEQFYLKSLLAEPQKEKEAIQESKPQPDPQCPEPPEPQVIPFPYYLSIFTENAQQNPTHSRKHSKSLTDPTQSSQNQPQNESISINLLDQ